MSLKQGMFVIVNAKQLKLKKQKHYIFFFFFKAEFFLRNLTLKTFMQPMSIQGMFLIINAGQLKLRAISDLKKRVL